MEIKYTKLENEVKIQTGDLSSDFSSHQLPLKLQIVKSVNKNLIMFFNKFKFTTIT